MEEQRAWLEEDPWQGVPWEGLGDTPRDLGSVTLDLGNLVNRGVVWRAVGVLLPADLEELSAAGDLEDRIEARIEARPVRGEDRMRVRVRGESRGMIHLTCVRCLVDFVLPLAAGIDATFAVGVDPAAKNKKWRIEEDVEYLPDGMLKIRHLVEEELLLALPMNPVCVSGCVGLCAECGADLNRGPCGCQTDASAGPFAVLKTLQST